MKNNRLSRFAIPYVIWMALFVVAPIVMVVIYIILSTRCGFTLDNFAKMGTYTVVFTRSFSSSFPTATNTSRRFCTRRSSFCICSLVK